MAWNLHIDEVLKACSGTLLQSGQEIFSGVSTDTRLNNEDKIFIALKGDNYDANEFLDKASASSAACIICHKSLSQQDLELINSQQVRPAIVLVKDTLLALQSLANYWRNKNNYKVIGITGTNGKTSVKEFLYSIMKDSQSVVASKGSLNNHWGVPITLLSANEEVEYIICEMGMNHPGELKILCDIAQPDFAMVTFVGRGHLEGMGTVEAVAHEKEEIYRHSKKDAVFVFNLDNKYTREMKDRYLSHKTITFSGKNTAPDVQFQLIKSDLSGIDFKGEISNYEFEQRAAVFGRHNIVNLMAASAMALAIGMNPEQIASALINCESTWGRNQLIHLDNGTQVLFDAYNANPDSMDAFFQCSGDVSISGKKVAILGDMLELGEESDAYHKEVGKKAAHYFDQIFYIGQFFKQFQEGLESAKTPKKAVISDTYKLSLANEIKSMLQPEDVVFMKASRGVHLEKFLDVFKE